MCSHPGYPRKSADYPSGCFHGFPDTRAANGRATQIWHTRTENTVNDARIGVDVQEKRRKYDRADSNDHTPYENRGLSAGIRTVDGAILAGHDGRRSRIYHTAVDPDARGRGIGSMLVGRVVETLRTIGLPKVAVGVPADNDAGNDFWERQGFAVRDDLVYRELPL